MDGLVGIREPAPGVVDAAAQGVLVRKAGMSGPGDDEAAEHGDQIEIPLSEQIGGVVGDVVIGEAALPFVRPGEHRGGELALRLHVEEDPEVEELDEVLDDGIGFECRAFWLRLWLWLRFRFWFWLVLRGGEERVLLLEGLREGEAKLLELVDEGDDQGLGAEDVFLLLVEGFSLGDALFHLEDAIVFLAEATDALANHAEDGAVCYLRRGS